MTATTNDEAIIRVDQFGLQYPYEDRPILDQVSLTIRPGEFVLLMGPSGAGKSSLALSLNGAIPKIIKAETWGQIDVLNEPIADRPIHEISMTVGMVLQDPDTQFATLSVADEAAFALENLRVAGDEVIRRRDAALDRVGLAHKRNARLDRLSGGEKQRLALASILVMNPRVLVLDEPTANLDPLGAREVFALIRSLKSDGISVLLIEHRVDALVDIVDRIVVLNRAGRIVADAPPLEVFESLSRDDLEELGVWLPEVVRLAFELRRQGLDSGPLTLSANEFARALPVATVASLANFNLPGGTTETLPPTPSAPQIAVRGLTYRYPDGTLAVESLELDVFPGEFLAIVGVNGSGKTTLALAITGLIPVNTGTIFFSGIDVTSMSAGDLTSHFAYVFQNPEHQFVTDTVEDEIAYSLRLQNHNEAAVAQTVDGLLAEFGLTDRRHANPFSISQGEKRRLSVASMLALRQEVIILDEPTFGQDRQNADAMMDRLRELHRSGRTVVMITHDMRLVAEYATQVLVLRSGAQTFLGTPAGLFQDNVLDDAGLDYPPIAEVSHLLRARLGAFPELISVPAFIQASTTMAPVTPALEATPEGR